MNDESETQLEIISDSMTLSFWQTALQSRQTPPGDAQYHPRHHFTTTETVSVALMTDHLHVKVVQRKCHSDPLTSSCYSRLPTPCSLPQGR